MSIKKILNDKKSSLVISVVFGLGIISLLYACTGDDCKDYIGPKKNTLKDIHRVNGKCVTFEEKSVKCDDNKKKLHIK
tara:strand:+ start:410 stop:643 length:234 start_codon:yes stop_codon:yes gene_type:complete